MQVLHDSYTKTGRLHHAYVLEGVLDTTVDALKVFCNDTLCFATRGNPDFVHDAYDTFLIDHARQLREQQQNKTQAGSRKIFVISFNFITREAQNALLKVLEEPTDGTHIFIVTPSAHVFLPTVRSRVSIIAMSDASTDEAAHTFIKASYKKRLALVADLVKDIKDEKASKADALRLVRGIVRTLHADTKRPEKFGVLKELQRIASYLEDTSASVKQLLEHVALVV